MKLYFLPPLVLQKLIWVPTRLFLILFGRLQINGMEHLEGVKGPIIFACNHLSEMDVFMVPATLGFLSRHSPIFYTSREKSFYNSSGWRQIFYGGFFFKLWGAYPVFPGKQDYAKSLVTHINIVKDGGNICIFPEGRRSRDGNMLPAKGGVAFLARATNAPIVPVRIDGTFRSSLWSYLLGHKRLGVTFCKPIVVHDLAEHGYHFATIEDYKHVAELVMTQIRAASIHAPIQPAVSFNHPPLQPAFSPHLIRP